MVDTVNPDNFNETMKGYIIRACRIAEYTEEQRSDFFNGIRWSINDMTMEEARIEWQEYIDGRIRFKRENIEE